MQLWSGRAVPSNVGVANGRVFFTAFNYPDRTGSLMDLNPQDGIPSVDAVFRAAGTCMGLIPIGAGIYWSRGSAGTGSLNRSPGRGSNATLTSTFACPGLIAAAGGDVFWTSDGGALNEISPNGEARRIWSSEATIWGLSSDGSGALFVAVDGAIVRVESKTYRARTLTTGAGEVGPLAYGAGSVFMAQPRSKQIVRLDARRGTPQCRFLTDGSVTAMTATADALYWAESSGPTIMTAPLR